MYWLNAKAKLNTVFINLKIFFINDFFLLSGYNLVLIDRVPYRFRPKIRQRSIPIRTLNQDPLLKEKLR